MDTRARGWSRHVGHTNGSLPSRGGNSLRFPAALLAHIEIRRLRTALLLAIAVHVAPVLWILGWPALLAQAAARPVKAARARRKQTAPAHWRFCEIQPGTRWIADIQECATGPVH